MPDTPKQDGKGQPQILHSLSEILAPLQQFYLEAELECLKPRIIEPEEMPEPYHSLLVHERDMTSTLIDYHQEEIALRVYEVILTRDSLSRHLALERRDRHRPLEYGAIRIHLSVLPDVVQQRIVEGRDPLGGLLNSHGIEYESSPVAFIELHSAGHLNRAFPVE